MNIGILGAGHGGLAAASDLTLMGHCIKLSAVKEHNKNLKLILISFIALILFVIRANKIDFPLLNLNIFKVKNFDFANIAMF